MFLGILEEIVCQINFKAIMIDLMHMFHTREQNGKY
jgi:hypothetical protein